MRGFRPFGVSFGGKGAQAAQGHGQHKKPHGIAGLSDLVFSKAGTTTPEMTSPKHDTESTKTPYTTHSTAPKTANPTPKEAKPSTLHPKQ